MLNPVGTSAPVRREALHRKALQGFDDEVEHVLTCQPSRKRYSVAGTPVSSGNGGVTETLILGAGASAGSVGGSYDRDFGFSIPD